MFVFHILQTFKEPNSVGVYSYNWYKRADVHETISKIYE